MAKIITEKFTHGVNW